MVSRKCVLVMRLLVARNRRFVWSMPANKMLTTACAHESTTTARAHSTTILGERVTRWGDWLHGSSMASIRHDEKSEFLWEGDYQPGRTTAQWSTPKLFFVKAVLSESPSAQEMSKLGLNSGVQPILRPRAVLKLSSFCNKNVKHVFKRVTLQVSTADSRKNKLFRCLTSQN